MRIKKTSQYIEGGASLSNVYGTSNENGYTQEYINGLNTYSTNEQRIGTYDGKPLYRKMIKTTTPNSTTNSVVATYSNTYKVKNFYGNIYISASNQVLPLNFYFTNEYNVATYCTDTTGNINMKVGIASYQSQNVEIILEYTKTTD